MPRPMSPRRTCSTHTGMARRMWMSLMLGLLFAMCKGSKEETSDIHNYLQDLNGKESTTNQQQVLVGVRRLWGIPDTTASVGRIFSYVIPEDAFSGEVERYIVTEAGEQILPSWLYFEEETRTFRGVPTEQDVGHAYISVKAVAKSTEDDPLIAKDVFSIEVVDDSFQFTNREREKCPALSSRTVLTVIADANMADLPPYRRYDLLTKMASIMKLETRDMKLVTLGGGKAFDDQAIAAGPGNTRNRDGAGVILKWIVGCDGTVKDTESVSSVEKLAKSGELATQLGLPIVGWHVTNQQPTTQVRMKRQNRVFGTPVPGIVPTLWTSETIDDIEPSEDSIIPEMRVVPTMSSPIYTSTSHRHRHHHSATDRGHRHHVVPSSPVFMLHSTPVIVPVAPTDHLESSLFTEDIVQSSISTPHIYPTEVMTPTPSMTESEIQPSRTYTTTAQPTTYMNSNPVAKNKVIKLTMIAGKLWTYQIPQNAFTDFEDGDARNLKLMFLTSDRESVPQNSWVQFDPVKQELYALPLDEHRGHYNFSIEAMDSEGKSTFSSLKLRVLKHPGCPFSHVFKMVMKLHSYKLYYLPAIDWQIEVLRRIARLNNDPDDTSIVVRKISVDPLTFSWTNDTLEDCNTCPQEDILNLYNHLTTDNGVARPLRKIMNDKFKVQEVTIDFEGKCKPQFTTEKPLHPIVRNPIEIVNATVGDVLQYIIPADTFFDEEDGDTRNLTLELKAINHIVPDKASWILFDTRSQMIQGIPSPEHVGKHEYQIIAMDKEGNYESDAFIIDVKARRSQKITVEFGIHLDENFDEFNNDIMKKVLVAKKLARMYGDSDARNMRIIRITQGSVIYTWTNKTLPINKCATDTITQLVRKLIKDDNTVSEELIRALQPEFRVTKAVAVPLRHCIDIIPEESVEYTWSATTAEPPLEETTPKPATTSDDDIYITTVIPAVVIAIMLIIAAMVACFLYRKKRKGKMTMQDTSGFMSKGVPIIFADEIEEKSDPAKPPVIMKDEKPPLSQPTYQTTGSTEPTPQIERREPQTDPPYQPPPPFTTSREAKNGRPKATPTYRQPPPYYVPP